MGTALNSAKGAMAQLSGASSEDKDFKTLREASWLALSNDSVRIHTFAERRQVLQFDKCFGRTFICSSSLDGKVATAMLAALGNSFGLDVCAKLGIASLAHLKRRFSRCISPLGRLRWKRVFGLDRAKLPVKLEVGAGTGEWAVAQAKAQSTSANWGALELMHDRIYSIFSRAAFEAVPNLSILGGDAAFILAQRIMPGSVDHVFANFPEPPHVSGSDVAESSLHLWADSFFKIVHEVLKPTGRLTILSDNRKYSQSLARAVGSLRGKDGCGMKEGELLFVSSTVPILTEAEATAARERQAHARKQQALMAVVSRHEYIGGVCLHHGTPGNESGHAVKATSQFDSRWESSQWTERYFLSLVAQ